MILRAAALALALALGKAPAYAGVAEDRAELAALQADDARLQAVGWRLATGNARFCPAARPAIGLLLQDMAAYADPARWRAAAGLAGEIGAQAAVPGAPAAAAGLAANDTITAIGDQPMAALPPAKANTWQRLTGLHDRIDAALAADGAVRIAWQDRAGAAHDRRIAGVAACATRFELLDSGSRASADGTRVVIGRRFAAMRYAEPELAAALAHELAHNILAHRAWLARVGRKQGNIRVTEREADRLMPWLLANAGYDPAAAVTFFRRWGPTHDGGLFRKRTHDGWDERAEFVAAELPLVASAARETGAADWTQRFRRETAD